jgi:hypothetical protein
MTKLERARERVIDEYTNHDDPYHVCVTLKSGVVHRHMTPNFVAVSHECGQKPRIRWIAKLPKVKRAALSALKRSKK